MTLRELSQISDFHRVQLVVDEEKVGGITTMTDIWFGKGFESYMDLKVYRMTEYTTEVYIFLTTLNR